MPENMIEERERNAAQLIDSTIIRKLVIKNEMTEVERLCDFVMSFCQQLSVTNKCANNVCLAVEEAVVNVINYAYPHGTQGSISIMMESGQETLTVVIKDRGKPFDPTKVAEVDVSSDAEHRQIGGLGIFIIKRMMDRMDYERTPDGYNLLRLEKNIKHLTTSQP